MRQSPTQIQQELENCWIIITKNSVVGMVNDDILTQVHSVMEARKLPIRIMSLNQQTKRELLLLIVSGKRKYMVKESHQFYGFRLYHHKKYFAYKCWKVWMQLQALDLDLGQVIRLTQPLRGPFLYPSFQTTHSKDLHS